MQALLGIVWFIIVMGYGILQIIAGYVGIDFHFGAVWAGVAIFSALIFRFTLPITIGAFFGAIDVWGWHWGFATLFAAPGLAFLIPGVILSIIESIKK